MLTKFETKSNRVKGLAFHPKRPWILSSLHNGSIQLWDFRMGTLLDRFEEHEGPVRGVHFHPSQNLFVSGGDDYKIKVWNYKLRRCIFTLMGHLDYIRTVYFHPDSPWIVSASDDQTVRIWDWQNRTCLLVLTGHNHYVMSAAFHPAEDLVVSASLDQTIRVWDISSLRMKSERSDFFDQPTPPMAKKSGAATLNDFVSNVRGQLPASVKSELFGTPDGVVKFVLEGHTRGVNWACFHPTLPLIVSGADDRQAKLWRMSDNKCWEVDTLRGHLNNISCVQFHPKQELVISNSEDKTVKVWDLNKRTCLYTFRRDNDRFWVLAVHPTINLIAAGHDTGMIVFKLARERPAYSTANSNLIYVKNRFIRSLNYDNGQDQPLSALKENTPGADQGTSSAFGMGSLGVYGGSSSLSLGGGSGFMVPPRSMSYNPLENVAILNFDSDGGTYELYALPKSGSSENLIEPRRGVGVSAIFVGRNRFATLDKNVIIIRDLFNEVTKRVPTTLQGADMLFPASSGYALVRNEEKVALQDLQQKKIVAEVAAPSVKYVIWNDDNSKAALLGKHSITIVSRRLESLATVHETIRVKSAAWDDAGVLLYSTLNHIKYCLPNGDSGIVSTLKQPIYLTRVRGPAICYLDRNGDPGIMPIDPAEYTFKLLLLRKRYDDVRKLIEENRLCGQSIIAYLQEKGFPEVALHFVRDEKTRFALAIDSNAIDIALESAQKLDNPKCWRSLADVALKQGNLEVVELCYLRTKDLEKLAFLYVITGNYEKLSKMNKIAESSGNMMARFQISNYLGDVESRAKTMAECGQPFLGKLAAATHGLTELAAELGDGNVQSSDNGKLLLPPVPLRSELNWPLLSIQRGLFKRDPNAGNFEEPTGDPYEEASTFAESERDPTWDEAPQASEDQVDPFAVGLEKVDDGGEGGGWGDDDFDIDLGVEGNKADEIDEGMEQTISFEGKKGEYYVPPSTGPGASVRWARTARLPGELVAAGDFAAAMKLLVQQIGAISFIKMKPAFMDLYLSSTGSSPGLPGTISNEVYFSRLDNRDRPQILLSLGLVRDKFKEAQKFFTLGKFSNALEYMTEVIVSLPLLVVENAKEADEVKEILAMASEYVTGLKVEIAQKKAKADGQSGRQVQLAGLLTKCRLVPVHLQLALRAAMKTAYDTKNYISASSFARRLLDTNTKADLAASAKKVMQICDKNMTNQDEIDYDDRRDFSIDGYAFVPLYAGQPYIQCPYCKVKYAPESKDKLCNICEISKIGATAEGLRVFWE